MRAVFSARGKLTSPYGITAGSAEKATVVVLPGEHRVSAQLTTAPLLWFAGALQAGAFLALGTLHAEAGKGRLAIGIATDRILRCGL